jgi:MFS family permease
MTAAVLPQKRLNVLDQFYLSFFWFAVSAHWGAIISVLVQSQVVVMVGNDVKGRAAGLAIALGSITGIIVPPLMGAWSDRVKWRLGRRRPFMLIGTAINLLALVGLASFPFLKTGSLWGFTGAYWLYVGAYVMANLFNNFATAPYTALLPDIVPPDQRGAASGWYGLMFTLGNGAGIFLAGSLVSHQAALDVFHSQINLVYLLLGIILVVGVLITVLGVRERPLAGQPKPFSWAEFLGGMVAPFRSRDFFWVFFTRLLVTMGVYSVLNFLQFFMEDVVKDFRAFGVTLATTPEGAVQNMLVILLLVAVPASIVGGQLSDKYGRKLLVYISGGLQAVVSLILIFFHQYVAALLVGVLFGIGYGAYQSVDWALVTDVLPNLDDAAKDMGIWHISLTLPQLIATPLAGVLLDTFQAYGRAHGQPALGYTVIFWLAVVYFLLGTVFVKQVKKAR